MNDNDKTILRQFADDVRREFSGAEIWAYGSRVYGNASDYSDFDVCVVLDKLDESIDKIIIDIAWEIGFKHGVVISTVTFSKNDFKNGAVSSSPFVKSILLSGFAA